jgi:LCP family protein required for cell wall assembly
MADDPGHGPRRTWPERLAIVGTFVSALVCFIVAAALIAGYVVIRQRNIVDLQDPSEVAAAASANAAGPDNPPETLRQTTTTTTSTTASAIESDETVASTAEQSSTTADVTTTDAATTSAAPPATFPDADPDAQNFLITGADNGACVDPDSPYYAAFGDREGMGERSDTIMVLRVDPDADRVAVLSFPRDLYVDIAGSGSKSRINSAYQRDDPQRLIDTIFANFGVPIDHYIQVDFCAFKTLVDAVGGVAVPFEFPARDDNTGLNVPATGCFTFDGEHALAYVRSRHYEYEDPPGSGNFQEDPSSDLGRISRQQDFIRRTLSSILGKGPLNPRVARGLIRAATEYVVTDRDLTAARMLEFAGVMNDVDPESILTYQIEASDRNVNGAAVLIPNTDGENMQAIIAMFRGETSLADAPTQVFDDTTTAVPRGSTTTNAPNESTTVATTAPSTTVPPATEVIAESSVPSDGPQENQVGIVPPRDATC